MLVEDGAHPFPQLVLDKELRFVFDLLDLVSLLKGSHSPVFKLWKAVEIWRGYVLQNFELVYEILLFIIFVGDIYDLNH